MAIIGLFQCDPWCLPTQNWLKNATNDISIHEFHNVTRHYVKDTDRYWVYVVLNLTFFLKTYTDNFFETLFWNTFYRQFTYLEFPFSWSATRLLTAVFLSRKGFAVKPLGRRVRTTKNAWGCLSLIRLQIVLMPSAISSGESPWLYEPICKTTTLGDKTSNSPFCNLHKTCSIRLPLMPKLRLCIWQKCLSQMWLLTRSCIRASPTHRTSGSASLASEQNRLCWNK